MRIGAMVPCTTVNAMRCISAKTVFLATLAYLKQERRTAHMFETDPKRPGDDFGLAAKDDFFRESH